MEILGAVYFQLALGLSALGIVTLLFRLRLRQARALLWMTFVLALVPTPLKKIGPIPSAQLWSAPSMRAAAGPEPTSIVSLGNSRYSTLVPLFPFTIAAWFLISLGFIYGITRLVRSFLFLSKLRWTSPCFRRLGRLEIRVSNREPVPLSFWLPKASVVLVPEFLLDCPGDLAIAIRHEIQHHRQGDTRWLYGIDALSSLFFWNPFAQCLSRSILEIQEFACDEALVLRKRVSPQAYGGCLLRVAENARRVQSQYAGTACAALGSSASLLKRRIVHMLIDKKTNRARKFIAWIGTAIGMMCVVTGWATQFGVQDRRISWSQAEAVVSSRSHSSFPITLNESVLKALNLYAGTPDGREYIQSALTRMESYRPMVQEKLSEYHLPEELLALPIMESGYQNLPQNPKPLYSAGVWQFIPQTARNFGLRVDKKKDDRLNVERETDAASRYLSSLYLRFRDWELAVLAYNAGENGVQRGINQTGKRNAWDLIEAGFGGDSEYLARMIAAVILMQSPQLVK